MSNLIQVSGYQGSHAKAKRVGLKPAWRSARVPTIDSAWPEWHQSHQRKLCHSAWAGPSSKAGSCWRTAGLAPSLWTRWDRRSPCTALRCSQPGTELRPAQGTDGPQVRWRSQAAPSPVELEVLCGSPEAEFKAVRRADKLGSSQHAPVASLAVCRCLACHRRSYWSGAKAVRHDSSHRSILYVAGLTQGMVLSRQQKARVLLAPGRSDQGGLRGRHAAPQQRSPPCQAIHVRSRLAEQSE